MNKKNLKINDMNSYNVDQVSGLDNVVTITRFTSENGYLAKEYDLIDGKITKTPAANMSAGVAERVQIKIKEIPEFICDLDEYQAIGFGEFSDTYGDSVSITTKSKISDESNKISRSKDNFRFSQKPGLMHFDYDISEYGPNLTLEKFIEILKKYSFWIC